MTVTRRLPPGLHRVLRRLWREALAPARGRMRSARQDFAARVPFDTVPPAVATPRIAVVCHLFHDELADEFRRELEHLPAADLYLSTDAAAKVPAIERAFAGWGKGTLDIRVMPNRGRDIAPKLVGFADVYARYDLILFVHSKKSLTSSLGNDWRRLLLTTLSGSPAIVASILSIFDHRPDVGIVMAQHFAPIRGLLHWDGNFAPAAGLARRMGFRLRRGRTLDFPSGSMFWARPAALRPLLDLQLDWDDFPAEHNQVRGTVQHAVERLFLLASERAGFRWMKIAASGDMHGDAPVVPIPDAAALDAFLARRSVTLLPAARRRA